MMLITKIIDAFTDPMMGAIADRTRSRFGKFRPYLLWFALPFGLFSVLAFTTPDFSENGKMWYAFLTYTLLMLVYTGREAERAIGARGLAPPPEGLAGKLELLTENGVAA